MMRFHKLALFIMGSLVIASCGYKISQSTHRVEYLENNTWLLKTSISINSCEQVPTNTPDLLSSYVSVCADWGRQKGANFTGYPVWMTFAEDNVTSNGFSNTGDCVRQRITCIAYQK